MKIKIMALFLCAGLLITTLAGCNLKLTPDTGASPDAADNSGDGAEDGASPGTAEGTQTVLGIVGNNSAGTITLELVQTYDTSPDSTPPPDATVGSHGYVTSGSAVYILTGETQMVSIDNDTVFILESEGYAPGRITDIVTGDFLAVVYSGGRAAVVIDNEANPIVSADSQSGASASPEGYSGNTEAVAPNPSGTLSPPSGEADAGDAKTYKVTEQDLKARSGPGTSYEILGMLDLDEEITGVVTDGWLKFTYEGQTAYSSADYLAPVD